MPTQVINNLGQYGIVPDAAPQVLPPNAFTYARNWRFNEGNFAEITTGYTNAFEVRTNRILGTPGEDLTFLYTWNFGGVPAAVVYNDTAANLKFIENNNAQEPVVYSLDFLNQYSRDVVAIASGTPSADQIVATGTTLTVGTGTQAVNDAITAAATAGSTAIVFLDGVEIDRFTVISATVNNTTATITIGEQAPALTVGSTYTILLGRAFTHNTAVTHRWQGTDVNGVPILNNGLEAPWILNDTNRIPFVNRLDNWPRAANEDATCVYMAKYSSFLIALGYQHTTGAAGERGSSRTLAISDVITTPGVLPAWDFEFGVGASSSFSQIFDLSLVTDGDLVSAEELNGILYIHTTTDIIEFNYLGDGQFSAQRLPIPGGVLTSRSSTRIPNGFFNIGNGIIYTHDGSTFDESLAEGVFRESWFNAIDEGRRAEIQVVYDQRLHSVWIKTPISNLSQEVWIYNLSNKTLSIVDDHQEIRYIEFTSSGVPARTTTWDNLPATWDSLPEDTWNEFPVEGRANFIGRILSVGDNQIFVHDIGQTFNGRTIIGILQREFYNPGQDTYGTFTCTRMVPWIDALTGVTTDIRLGSAAATDRMTTWRPYRSYTSGTSRRVDFRVNTSWLGFTFRSDDQRTRLNGFELELQSTDRR